MLKVTLASGARILLVRALVDLTPTGYRYPLPFEAAPAGESTSPQRDAAPLEDSFDVLEETFEAVEESLHVKKVPVVRDHVRVTTHVVTREEVVDIQTSDEEISVVRVAVGRVVDSIAEPRTEGDTLIVPVYEEVYVVEKRLILREEVRVTRTRSQHTRSETVTLRSEQVNVERVE